MIKSGIYRIRNIVNNKCYYGSAVCLDNRWKYSHLPKLRQNKHWNQHLQNAWNKNGEENFVFEVVEEVLDKSKLLDREQYYLDVINPEYNMSKSARGGSGLKSENAKRKISERKKEWWRNNKELMVGSKHPFYGKKFSLETRKKMAANRKNKLLTAEQVLKIRELYTTSKTTHRKLGKQFLVDHRTIGKILNKQIYIYV